MVFTIIGIIITVIMTVLLGLYSYNEASDGALIGSVINGIFAIAFVVFAIVFDIDARENKALIRAHLENPANYTYSQLAEHNEFVAKAKVWQGTIFSFYNDTDLQTIDIDSISQKVIIHTNGE